MFLANKLNKGGSLSQTDLQFNYVTMLLHGDGTNGAQNNTFLDSSTNNFTITRNGNTTQGSFSPYGSNWSNYFDGSGDDLTVPDNAALELGSSNFTIEAWVNFSSLPSDGNIYSVGGKWGAQGVFSYLATFRNDGGTYKLTLFYSTDGSSVSSVNVNWTPSVGTWYHLAYVRSGSNFYFFANGTQVSTTQSVSGSFANTSVVGSVGSASSGGGHYLNGYISNYRLVNGTAVYTSNFTPSTTPLTAITNTSLLTCQSNRFIDNSANNFTITKNGDVSVQRFNPFGASTAYSTSVIGGSGYFDGSGDYLRRDTDSEELRFGTGNYTVEGWFNFSAMSSDALMGLVAMGDVDSSGTLPWFGFYNTGGWQLGIYQFGNIGSSSRVAFTPKFNQWYHLAFERISGTNYIYINGVQQSITNPTIHSSTNWQDSGGLRVGTIGASNYFFKGFISDVRIVKGTGVYTSNFTPNTAPLTAITNTQLLLGMTNGAIFDNAMMNDLETVGNAQISTSVKKYGTGSLAFDGSGDYLTTVNKPPINLEGDFTVEGWVYQALSGANSPNISLGADTFQSGTFFLYISTTQQLGMYVNGSVTLGSTTAAVATWHHVAMVRSGSTITFYLDGASQGTTTNSVVFSGPVDLGSTFFAGTRYYGNGYIDDLRITKGYARYTSTFTPPTAALSDTGPT